MEGNKNEKEKMEERGIRIKKEKHRLFRVYKVSGTLCAKFFFLSRLIFTMVLGDGTFQNFSLTNEEVNIKKY